MVLAVNKTDPETNLAARQEEIQETFGARFAGLFCVSALTNEAVDTTCQFAADVGHGFVAAMTNEQPTVVDLPGQTENENDLASKLLNNACLCPRAFSG
jgi:hypothetical protein